MPTEHNLETKSQSPNIEQGLAYPGLAAARMLKLGGESFRLSSPANDPSIIARDQQPLPLQDETINKYETLTTALLDLETHYGIGSPGVGNMLPQRDSETESVRHTWLTAQRVEGVQMSAYMSRLPPSLVLETLEKIVRYYEDALQDPSDKLYLSDLALHQVMYGHLPDEDSSSDRPILVDIDPRLSNNHITTRNESDIFTGAERLASELELFRSTFPNYRVDRSLIRRTHTVGNRLYRKKVPKVNRRAR